MKCINCQAEYEGDACPKCGLTARYSRVLYRYEERQREKRAARSAQEKTGKGVQKKNRRGKETAKLVIGIVSMALFIVIVFQSCTAGLVGSVAGLADKSVMGGFLLAITLLIGGIVGVATRKSIGGGAFASALYALGALIGFWSRGIFADLMVWSFLSLAFGAAFLGLVITELPRRGRFKKWWFYAVTLLLLLAFVGMLAGGGDAPKANAGQPEPAGAAQPNEAQPASAPAQEPGLAPAETLETDAITVEYISHEVVKDWEGKDALEVVVAFTNHKEEAVSYMLAAADKAFQDGVQLEPAIVTEKAEGLVDTLTEVKKDTPVQVAVYYALRNTDSDVEFEVQELFSFSGSQLKTTLKLK